MKANYSRWTRYWSSWILDLFQLTVVVGVNYFIAYLVTGGQPLSQLSKYGGDYVSYLVVGIILTRWISHLYDTPFSALLTAYKEGSLETYTGRPWGLESFIIGNILWSCLYYGFNTTIMFIFSFLVLGIQPSTQINPITLTLIVLMTFLIIVGLSLIETAFFGIYEFRFMQTPISLFMYTAVPVLSGLMFPISLFPDWIQKLSRILPHTYIYEAFRLCFIEGSSITSPIIQNTITVLSIFAIIFVPAGILLYKAGIRRAEKEGTLSVWV